VICIVAHRYGWIPEDQSGGGEKSISWLECEEAAYEGKEVLAFLVNDNAGWPAELREAYQIMAAVENRTATPQLLSDVSRRVAHLEDFKKWLTNTARISVLFRNPDDLRGQVTSALYDWKARNSRLQLPNKLSRPLRVFLCHSSGDKLAVRELYKQLKDPGVEPWRDEEKLIPGQDWDTEIRKSVRASDVVIVCLSRGAITKEGYVQKEIKQALNMSDEKPEGTIYLIPLRLENCEVPGRLRRWQWVDYFESRGRLMPVTALQRRAADLGLAAPQEDGAGSRSATTYSRPPCLAVFHNIYQWNVGRGHTDL
jgi:hypothetical protein